MKACLKNFSIVVLVLIASIIMLSGDVFAVNLPSLGYVGDFNFIYSHKEKGQPVYDYELTLSSMDITGGKYMDGTSFGEGSDPVTDAWFETSAGTAVLYNSSDNLTFGGTSGTTDPITISLTDGSNTFFTATLNNFLVLDGSMFGTRLDPGYENVYSVTYNTGAPYSQYIEELKLTDEPFNLRMDFTFNSGTSGNGLAFTEDSSGTVGGTLYAGNLSVVPEPVSSVLFLTGGATLALRRYRKKKEK